MIVVNAAAAIQSLLFFLDWFVRDCFVRRFLWKTIGPNLAAVEDLHKWDFLPFWF